MRYLLIILFLLSVVLVGYGFYVKTTDPQLGERCIGLGTAAGFFLWMPLFLYHRWKGKKVKDYMLTKENLEKMRSYREDKKV